MITISLCMITKNEEDVIERCINSVKEAVDEIIIVDTGSTDKTVEKVRQYDIVKVYDFKWVDDFAKARNYSFSKATKDYILWLDADDILFPEDKDKLIQLKSNLDSSIDSVTMTYIYARDAQGNPTVSLRRNRLVKREKNYQWFGRIHEYIDVRGKVMNSDITVSHFRNKPHGSRNLEIFEKMKEENVVFTPRDMYYYANELKDNGRLDEAIKMYKQFIDTNQGWVEDVKGACTRIADCYSYKGDEKNEFIYMLKSLEYDIPRPDICCRIAYKFMQENNFLAAIFWYKAAIESKPDADNMAIWDPSTYTWIPYLQMCVCYSNLGQYEVANMYNEKAAEYVPSHSSVLHNREFFKDKI
ncbi:glycosyltransferase [Inconstantimicrobium mannanitabidum]|uniref:Beta 1,4 glucosyltransferase n=1 Tax=Inconstantimicrobium mannanitabidum TaxID=1604901 RepID=A0ACB5RHT4_9CLOT|nr:glycosyltransferase family 2 protein [Clostridium sp. TW13]GKX68668.1 beta 1,4 glucosyltransferase [Clostridium sp. TW13]